MRDPGDTPREPIPFPAERAGGRRRPRVRKLRLALVASGLGALALVSTAFGMMMALAADLPQLENREEFRGARNSLLLDRHGALLGVLTGRENRILVRGDQISPAMKQAIVAIEDQRFYENDGVDPKGIARALLEDVVHRRAVQGASTITQQFVKNALDAADQRTLFQKLREAALAYHLTRKWSKDKVLTEYLNAIYFGAGAYGVESAARTYFGWRHPGCGERPDRPCAAELQPEEAALLAGMVASPSRFDPQARPQDALARRNLVLRRMLEQGYLTPALYRRARAAPLPPREAIRPPAEKARAPYFSSWVKQQVIDRFGARRALGGGLRVRTTLDLALQQAAAQAVDEHLSGVQGPTAALVALDNRTGGVRAMVVGDDRDYNARPFNLATQGARQPGSLFKPFVLAQAMREDISPATVWESRQKVFRVGRTTERFVVSNYDDAYSGLITLANALTHSDNSVYAEVGLKVGPRRVARLARRMGIRTPVSSNYANSLGGLRHGVSPLDMAHAYETFAEGGVRVDGTLGPDGGPVGIEAVTSTGPARVRAVNRRRATRVLSPYVAHTTTEIMRSVLTQGTGTAAYPGGFAAGKTGTTENYGDAWFVGFDRTYTVAVWVGYPDRLVPMRTEYGGRPVTGGTYPAEIWRSFILAARAIDRDRWAQGWIRDHPGEVPPAWPGDEPVSPPVAPGLTPSAPATTTGTTTTTTPSPSYSATGTG
jgi:penicillin-binding protein 1A